MSNKVEISEKLLSLIKSEIDRTQVSAQRLLRGQKEAKTLRLTSGIIYSWLRTKTKTARQDHIDLALKLWKALPNADYYTKLDKNQGKDLTQSIPRETHKKLKKIQKLTGLLPSRIFKLRDDAPEYLNSTIVGNWLNVKDYKANPKHVHWVITASKEILGEALNSLK